MDITADKTNEKNFAAAGRLQLGARELTVKGGKDKKPTTFVINLADIKTVEQIDEKAKPKGVWWGGVVITRYDGRIFKICNGYMHSTNAAFVSFFYPAFQERVAQCQVERQKAEESQRTIEKEKEKEKNAVMDSARLEKLKKLVQVSKKLKITQIAQILDLSEKGVYDRIVDWAAEFGFTLDEDVVEFGAGRKDDFIASLDKAFKDWGKKVETQAGKV